LSDHLSLVIADVASADSLKASRMFGPYFDGDWMRGLRILNKEINNDSPRSFAHFEFLTESAGFIIATELVRAFRGRFFPRVKAKDFFIGIGDLASLVFYRYIHSRLYIPKNTKACLRLDTEQFSRKENKISLSDEIDEYGRKKLVIKWKISTADLTSVKSVADQFLSQWPGKSSGFPDLIPLELDIGSIKPNDAYHPVGTCRMGENEESVVDFNLKVNGLSNMWVVSTGVLPSAGTANPTFTMLCLANKLVSQIG
jgi:choline dehydrogenase-like flavoprotein